ncbi:MAG: cytidylate kinase-like family protein [Gammaproteobacteria bacterium]
MRCNADRMVESLINAPLTELRAINDAKADEPKTQETSNTIVVTISRSCGAMANEIAHLLAEALELRCCDCLILQEVARRANVDEALVRVLDEHVSIINSHYSDQEDHWWKRLINRYSFTHEDYQEYLAKTILSISLHGGVIIGRGANYILGPQRAFRVRLIGSLDKCAKRVAERDSLSLEQATEKVQEIDYERAEYIHKLYDADINDPASYDLIINTDRFGSAQAVELILEAMKKAGYRLPTDAFESIAALA